MEEGPQIERGTVSPRDACHREIHYTNSGDKRVLCEACFDQGDQSGKMKTVETLIDRRREIKDLPELIAKERRQMRNFISEQIQKEIKRVLGRRRQDKIEQILLEFRELKDIALCTTARRRAHIVEMEDEHGHKHSDQDGIAEVFASFHENLHTGRKIVKGPDTARTQSQPFTRKELTDALSRTRKGKAADDSGIVVEMLKQTKHFLTLC